MNQEAIITQLTATFIAVWTWLETAPPHIASHLTDPLLDFDGNSDLAKYSSATSPDVIRWY